MCVYIGKDSPHVNSLRYLLILHISLRYEISMRRIERDLYAENRAISICGESTCGESLAK